MMEFKQVSGVYKISNNVNDYVYIGKAVNLHNRIKDHRRNLKRGVYGNPNLHGFVKKFGFESLFFEIIRLCKKEDLGDFEDAEIKSVKKLFNCQTFIYQEEMNKHQKCLLRTKTVKLIK